MVDLLKVAIHPVRSSLGNLDHLAADQPARLLPADIGSTECDSEGDHQAQRCGRKRDLLADRETVLESPKLCSQRVTQTCAPVSGPIRPVFGATLADCLPRSRYLRAENSRTGLKPH